MNVLVIGGGGREHALVWKLSKSPLVTKLYCAPGNGGIAQIAECCSLNADDCAGLLKFAKEKKIQFVVVGPEVPLTKGIVDLFIENNIPAIGPSRVAAQLEGSKIFAKDIMKKAGVSTGFYETFTTSKDALKYLEGKTLPIVVKADGLAAGKGVTVAATIAEAEEAVKLILDDKIFGSAGNQLIIEEFLAGEEASMFALTDGTNVLPLVSSQDHKRAFDGDTGPNTGGMGAYSPAPVVTPQLEKEVTETIFKPIIKTMKEQGMPFKGILYAGLMIQNGKAKVLEFNVRFGDPEAQVLLPRLKTGLMEIFIALYEERLDKIRLEWTSEAAVTVVLASGGYPGKYEKSKIIHGLDLFKTDETAILFHAGTKQSNGVYSTDGGRVLNVTALGKDIKTAQENAYKAVKKIHFDKMHYRRDIADKALKRTMKEV
ncbi:MAG: phosphoribosylamine--glycine ligase [bacterium]|nr:phosphoribosylamine--glycine ligase [bacterium]